MSIPTFFTSTSTLGALNQKEKKKGRTMSFTNVDSASDSLFEVMKRRKISVGTASRPWTESRRNIAECVCLKISVHHMQICGQFPRSFLFKTSTAKGPEQVGGGVEVTYEATMTNGVRYLTLCTSTHIAAKENRYSASEANIN